MESKMKMKFVPDRDERIDAVAEEMWLDLELVAEAVDWTEIVYVRAERPGLPANRTGARALDALRRRDWATFGAAVHAAVDARLRERAADKLDADDIKAECDARLSRADDDYLRLMGITL
jgi:predicted RNase H-like nuclease